MFWNKVAPVPLSTHRPAGFDGSDPAAYPAALWDRYDGLVRGAQARRMDVLLSPSSPMPGWASECRGSLKVRKVCRPNPTQFKRFVAALGRRYSGTYADENQGGGILPRVARWSVWNEPNEGGWLQPQATRRGAVAPALYRELVRAAIKALQQTGHGSDEILMGETAPIGRSSGPPPAGRRHRGTSCATSSASTAAAAPCAGPRGARWAAPAASPVWPSPPSPTTRTRPALRSHPPRGAAPPRSRSARSRV